VEAATALLGYAFSLHVRQQAAFVLSECIKCVATAAAKGEAGVAAADGAALVGGLLKPLSEALHKEKELEPVDALLSVFLEVLKAGRLTGKALLSPPQLSGVVELLKQQLHADAKRRAPNPNPNANAIQARGARRGRRRRGRRGGGGRRGAARARVGDPAHGDESRTLTVTLPQP